VGSFDSGIRAASWAPDDSYLILVNGNGELLQMTRDFDVLYEAPLSTTDFGEGKTKSQASASGHEGITIYRCTKCAWLGLKVYSVPWFAG